jgi:hypothetical protein
MRVIMRRCATEIEHVMADGIPQAERSRRWRAGIAQRLEVIQAELRELGDQISRELAVVANKLAEQERRGGRQQ